MDNLHNAHIAIIGGGPAGLMAAEVLASAGCEVHVFDAMPSVGRKFLLAGRGGLNLTHSEASEAFITRYRMPRAHIERWLAEFDAPALRAWAHRLGIETFVGSSGRIFPLGMKTSPLLRAWLVRLAELQVRIHLRHRWQGWNDTGQLEFTTPAGSTSFAPSATILALGGGSWARLGSDGAWMPLLAAQGVATSLLRPANCGFEIVWSEHLRTRFAGAPVKSVVASVTLADGSTIERPGEFVITRHGVEGSLIYALSAPLRDQLQANDEAILTLDLAPGHALSELTAALSRPRGSDTLANQLRRCAGITGVKAALLRESCDAAILTNPIRLAGRIKLLPLRLVATRPIEEAISSAGGVRLDAVNDQLMLNQLPGVFCAGEMLDWEAPTGGYLLTSCFASARIAARGVLEYLTDAGNPQRVR
ncbi:MAG: TIGR03862 family flavoprotein [Rhodocyclaceae bacterium]|nr:TIGR03862 family flavoprotein [Rhodocyclaceae bacterium]MBP6109129.1 TIGR03862 family flavoprotein [Rhodocyclaceae bacterium]MBP6279496.1 TIGR03862 family flavoprotein [Rhodocyclaceae bacterium]